MVVFQKMYKRSFFFFFFTLQHSHTHVSFSCQPLIVQGKKKRSKSIIAYDYKPTLTVLLWTWLFLDLALSTALFLLHHSHLAIYVLVVALHCTTWDTQVLARRSLLGIRLVCCTVGRAPSFLQLFASSGYSLVSLFAPHSREFSEPFKGRSIPHSVTDSVIDLINLKLTVTC